MKKKNVHKFTAIILLITILTIVALAGTYAKYTANFTGSGSVQTADWNVDVSVDDGTTYSTSALSLTISDKVYPGGSGVVGKVTVRNQSNLVNANIASISISNVKIDNVAITTGHPLNGEFTLSIAPATGSSSSVAANGGTSTYDVSYEWSYGATRNDNAYAGKTITFDVTLVVDQVAN